MARQKLTTKDVVSDLPVVAQAPAPPPGRMRLSDSDVVTDVPTGEPSLLEKVKERLGRGVQEFAEGVRDSGGMSPLGVVRGLARGANEVVYGEGSGKAVDKAVEQAGTAGFGDEIRGVVAGAKNLLLPPSAGGGQGVGDAVEAYRGERDKDRAEQDRLRDQHPVLYTGTEIATSVALPSPTSAVKAVGLGGRLKQAGAAAAEAATIGLGQSTADLSEFAEAAKDVGSAAGLGAGANVAGQVVSKGFKSLKKAVVSKLTGGKEDLVDRIMNEIATGPTDAKTTPTKAKLIDRAREAIEAEVVTGPDAKKVRDAFLSEATDGRKQLRPILNDVNELIRGGYAEIEKAGRHLVNPADYIERLQTAVREAAQHGDDGRREVLKAVIKRFEDTMADAANPEPAILQQKAQDFRTKAAEALKAGDVDAAAELDELANQTDKIALEKVWKPDLETIRRFTTNAQKAAASAIGGLNLHMSASLKNEASAVTSEMMSDLLDAAVKGDEKLEKVASEIRRNNQRYHALKTIDDGLALREWKENTSDTPLLKAAKAVAVPAGIGLSTGLVTGAVADGDPFEKAAAAAGAGALGLAGTVAARKGLPAAARAIDRKLTTAVLEEERALRKLAAAAREGKDVEKAAEEARRAGVPERAVRFFLTATKGDQSKRE